MGPFGGKLIRGLLVAGGTALLVGVVGHLHAHRLLEDVHLQAGRDRAAQVATILGTDLLEPSTISAGGAARAALQRLVREDPAVQSLYTVVRRDGRDVIVLGAARGYPTRSAGAPVQLTQDGHRAFRTGDVTVARGASNLVHVPIRAADGEGDVLGMLVAEIAQGTPMSINLWTLLVLPLLAAGAMGFWLLTQFARPLARAHEDKRELKAQVRANAQQLKEAGRIRDEHISNTVHELRTPLSTIVAALDILQSFGDLPEDEAAEFLAQATTACQHMRFLVNDILDSAAMESGMFAVESESSSLNEILRAAERVMQPSALANSIELQVKAGSPDIKVYADPSRVLQVLFNLLSNAIKYSPQGRTVILQASSNPLAAVIEIMDEGEGVPLASRARLFSRFTRLSTNQEQVVEGSGIGLYLSKQLVELMNGSIGYRERDGEGETGSVFWFTLPLSKKPRVKRILATKELAAQPLAPKLAGTGSETGTEAGASPLEPTLDENT